MQLRKPDPLVRLQLVARPLDLDQLVAITSVVHEEIRYQKILDAAKSIKNAAATDDFSSYELALSKIASACQECHSVYKNN